MAKSMSPSNPISVGKAAKFIDVAVAALRKSGLPSEPTQRVLEAQGVALANEFVASVRTRVEAISDMIVRHVKVDRTRTPQAVLDATKRRQYTSDASVQCMPTDGRDEDDVYFFKVSRFISDDELEKELALRGLKRDPYAQAQVNIDDPAFADEHPNGTHWQDADGNWHFASFDRWGDERHVRVYRGVSEWGGYSFFGGVPI